jgi:hypothetical protein
MNIVPTYPNISLNTANVNTETARRDNQLRELITPTKQTEAATAEPRLASEQDKARQPGSSQLANQEALESKGEDNQRVEAKQQQEGQEQKRQEQQQQALEQLEEQALNQLKQRDREVRAHEQAHAAVGGQYAGSPTYEYERGADGNNYAVAGEVLIDISEVPNDPQATIEKMQQVKAAALAPQEPSGPDRAIAADANQKITAARAELTAESSSELNEVLANAGAEDKTEQSPANVYDFNGKRDTEINQRAERISRFYQAATSPFTQPNIANSI